MPAADDVRDCPPLLLTATKQACHSIEAAANALLGRHCPLSVRAAARAQRPGAETAPPSAGVAELSDLIASRAVACPALCPQMGNVPLVSNNRKYSFKVVRETSVLPAYLPPRLRLGRPGSGSAGMAEEDDDASEADMAPSSDVKFLCRGVLCSGRFSFG